MYYKVVRQYRGKLISSSTSFANGGIEYRVAEWVYPQPGFDGLFVFDTLEHASGYIWCAPTTLVRYTCEAEEPLPLPPHCTHWPHGTLAFGRVKLIAAVDAVDDEEEIQR